MRHYTIKEYVAEGVILASCFPYGQQVWTLSEQKVRKNHWCAVCDGAIKKGKHRAFRPLTNHGNRMDRICRKCGEPKLPASKKKIKKKLYKAV